MTATGIRMTADELFRLPDNGMRRELVAGELHERPPGGGEHGYVGGSALGEIRALLKQHPEVGGGVFTAETGFRLSRNPDTVRTPDVAYVGPDRLEQARVGGFPKLARDFVVEVVSPNDRAGEIQQTAEEWLRVGVRLVWVLYPSTRSTMTYERDGAVKLLHADEVIAAEPVLPGFACRLGDLF
jgi:Uma2 family endonuclease